MAEHCERAIRQEIKDVPINIDIVKDTNCIGNGTGIMYVAVVLLSLLYFYAKYYFCGLGLFIHVSMLSGSLK